MSRRVVVVEYRSDQQHPWFVWCVYDSIPALRSRGAAMGLDVPTAPSSERWRRYPWTWTNEYGGEYRASSQPLLGGAS